MSNAKCNINQGLLHFALLYRGMLLTWPFIYYIFSKSFTAVCVKYDLDIEIMREH